MSHSHRGYEKARLVHIPTSKKKKRGYGTRARGENVQDALRRAGYTDEQIAKLARDGRIMCSCKYITTNTKAGQELYVLDIPEDHDIEEHVDRFTDLELD